MPKATVASGSRTFRKVVRGQGRTFAGLARLSGYSENYVGAVARGEMVGSARFYLSMERILGEEIAWPKGLKRPDGAAA